MVTVLQVHKGLLVRAKVVIRENYVIPFNDAIRTLVGMVAHARNQLPMFIVIADPVSEEGSANTRRSVIRSTHVSMEASVAKNPNKILIPACAPISSAARTASHSVLRLHGPWTVPHPHT